MGLIKDIQKVIRIRKAVNQVKKIADSNEQLGIELQKAILNLKADLEVLVGLMPQLKDVCTDIKAIFDEKE